MSQLDPWKNSLCISFHNSENRFSFKLAVCGKPVSLCEAVIFQEAFCQTLGLKITVGYRTMSDQIKNCPTKWKTYRTFCPTGKIRGKIKCPTRLCLCSIINWRYPTKRSILSNKYLCNKSFLINKLQYPKYSFLQKPLYRITLQKYNSKSFVFTSSPANKQTKKHWILK